MILYDSAFKLVPFMAEDYMGAVRNAVKAGSDDRANDLLVQATENGLDPDRYLGAEVQEFVYSGRGMIYLDLRDYMRERWLEHADTIMIQRLQEVGSGMIWMLGPNGSMTIERDTTAFDRLVELIREKGVPSARAVGMHVYLLRSFGMEHASGFPDDPQWQQVWPDLKAAMDRGELPPALFAPVQDLADLLHGRPMTYGELLFVPTDEEYNGVLAPRAKLDAARRSVGLGPFDRQLTLHNVDPALIEFAE